MGTLRVVGALRDARGLGRAAEESGVCGLVIGWSCPGAAAGVAALSAVCVYAAVGV